MNWKDKINKKYMQISLYVIITVLIIYSLSLILKNAPAVARDLMSRLKWVIDVIKPVIIGFAFAYIIDPMVNFFERRYQRLKEVKVFRAIVAPRTWAAITSIFVLIIALGGLISLLVFTVTDQLRFASFGDITNLAEEIKGSVTGFVKTIVDNLEELDIQSDEIQQYIKNATTSIVTGLTGFIIATINSVINISDYLTTIIFSFIIGIYFIIDGRMFTAYMKKVCKALFTDKTNKRMIRTVHDLDTVFSGYIRGQLTDAIVMMFLISILLSIIGVKFAIVIGILSGIGNLIPYFGPIVAYISTSLVCLLNGDIKTWVIAMIGLFVIQAIDGNVIGPKLLSNSIQIHPFIIIVSLIFGSAVGGLLGMLLAVPIGAFLKLVFVRFIENRLENKEDKKG